MQWITSRNHNYWIYNEHNNKLSTHICNEWQLIIVCCLLIIITINYQTTQQCVYMKLWWHAYRDRWPITTHNYQTMQWQSIQTEMKIQNSKHEMVENKTYGKSMASRIRTTWTYSATYKTVNWRYTVYGQIRPTHNVILYHIHYYQTINTQNSNV